MLLYPPLDARVSAPLFAPILFLVRADESELPTAGALALDEGVPLPPAVIRAQIWTSLPAVGAGGGAAAAAGEWGPLPMRAIEVSSAPASGASAPFAAAALVLPLRAGSFESTARISGGRGEGWHWLGRVGENTRIEIASPPAGAHRLMPPPSEEAMALIADAMATAVAALTRAGASLAAGAAVPGAGAGAGAGIGPSTASRHQHRRLSIGAAGAAASSPDAPPTAFAAHAASVTPPSHPHSSHGQLQRSLSSGVGSSGDRESARQLLLSPPQGPASALQALLLDAQAQAQSFPVAQSPGAELASPGAGDSEPASGRSGRSRRGLVTSASSPGLLELASAGGALHNMHSAAAAAAFAAFATASAAAAPAAPAALARSGPLDFFGASSGTAAAVGVAETAYTAALLTAHISNTLVASPLRPKGKVLSALVQMVACLPLLRLGTLRARIASRLLGIDTSAATVTLDDVGRIPVQVMAAMTTEGKERRLAARRTALASAARVTHLSGVGPSSVELAAASFLKGPPSPLVLPPSTGSAARKLGSAKSLTTLDATAEDGSSSPVATATATAPLVHSPSRGRSPAPANVSLSPARRALGISTPLLSAIAVPLMGSGAPPQGELLLADVDDVFDEDGVEDAALAPLSPFIAVRGRNASSGNNLAAIESGRRSVLQPTAVQATGAAAPSSASSSSTSRRSTPLTVDCELLADSASQPLPPPPPSLPPPGQQAVLRISTLTPRRRVAREDTPDPSARLAIQPPVASSPALSGLRASASSFNPPSLSRVPSRSLFGAPLPRSSAALTLSPSFQSIVSAATSAAAHAAQAPTARPLEMTFFCAAMSTRQRALLVLGAWAVGAHFAPLHHTPAPPSAAAAADPLQQLALELFLNALQHVSPAYVHRRTIELIVGALSRSAAGSTTRFILSRALRVLFSKGSLCGDELVLLRACAPSPAALPGAGTGVNASGAVRAVPNMSRVIAHSLAEAVREHVSNFSSLQAYIRESELAPSAASAPAAVDSPAALLTHIAADKESPVKPTSPAMSAAAALHSDAMAPMSLGEPASAVGNLSPGLTASLRHSYSSPNALSPRVVLTPTSNRSSATSSPAAHRQGVRFGGALDIARSDGTVDVCAIASLAADLVHESLAHAARLEAAASLAAASAAASQAHVDSAGVGVARAAGLRRRVSSRANMVSSPAVTSPSVTAPYATPGTPIASPANGAIDLTPADPATGRPAEPSGDATEEPFAATASAARLWGELVRALARAVTILPAAPESGEGVTPEFRAIASCVVRVCSGSPLLRDEFLGAVLRSWPKDSSDSSAALLDLISHIVAVEPAQAHTATVASPSASPSQGAGRAGALLPPALRSRLVARVCSSLMASHIKVARNALLLIASPLVGEGSDSDRNKARSSLSRAADKSWSSIVRGACFQHLEALKAVWG